MNNYDPKKHHRRTIRLKGYDYSQEGAYFLTLVLQGRKLLFGRVENGEMIINDAGKMVEKWWFELPNKFSAVELCINVVMPNHFHGIFFLNETSNSVGADLRVRPKGTDAGDPQRISLDAANAGVHTGASLRIYLPDIVQWFKTMTTNEYIRCVKNASWTPFDGKLWQRNYYEHIIRNELELKSSWDYIEANPLNLGEDGENPDVYSMRLG